MWNGSRSRRVVREYTTSVWEGGGTGFSSGCDNSKTETKGTRWLQCKQVPYFRYSHQNCENERYQLTGFAFCNERGTQKLSVLVYPKIIYSQSRANAVNNEGRTEHKSKTNTPRRLRPAITFSNQCNAAAERIPAMTTRQTVRTCSGCAVFDILR